MRLFRGAWAAVLSMLPIAAPLLAATVLTPGGRPIVVRVLILIALCTSLVTVAKVRMAFARPASLEIRRKRPVAAENQPLIDSIGLVAFLAYLLGWLAFLPVDAVRLHLLPPPPRWAENLGLLAALVGCAIGQIALWQNEFAAPAVQKQLDQTVVSTGLYGVVRHPLYTGNLLFFAGIALWIGSLAGLLGVAVIFAATVARIFVEERHLRENLPGYAAYTRSVRSRLIPFVL